MAYNIIVIIIIFALIKKSMEKIQNLLNQVKIINQKNNEILDATGARFNIFKVCGVNHYENTHSAIIKEKVLTD